MGLLHPASDPEEDRCRIQDHPRGAALRILVSAWVVNFALAGGPMAAKEKLILIFSKGDERWKARR